MYVAYMVRAIVALAASLAMGCTLSRPPIVKQTFLLDVERARPLPASRPIHAVTLRIEPFAACASCQGEDSVYPMGNDGNEAVFFTRLFVSPRAMIAECTARWLDRAALFRAVVPSDLSLRAELNLDGVLNEMYGDLRNPAAPTAVLAVEFYLSQRTPSGDRIVYHRSLTQRVAIADGSPASVVRGLSAALSTILESLEHDLRALRLPPAAAGD